MDGMEELRQGPLQSMRLQDYQKLKDQLYQQAMQIEKLEKDKEALCMERDEALQAAGRSTPTKLVQSRLQQVSGLLSDPDSLDLQERESLDIPGYGKRVGK